MKTLSDTHIARQIENEGPLSYIKKALEKGFPCAVWRLPHQDQFFGIIDLRPDIKDVQGNLEEWPAGFAVNPFADHHPGKPELIKADILISWSESDLSIKQNPVLADQHLEIFQNKGRSEKNYGNSQVSATVSDFEHSVAKAIQSIHEGKMNKVVLSRYSDEKLPENFDSFDLFSKACTTYANAFVYFVHSPAHGQWFGATPETLLSIQNGQHFRTVSLAGTQKLDDEQKPSDVAWTQKEIEEQAMVSRYIIDCFKKIRLREYREIGPKTVKAGNMAHLQTSYEVDMEEVNMSQLGNIMMNLLHPTSAVCGMPLEPALSFIKHYEKYDRELYAGFLGPVNIENNIHLFVNLRCFKILKDSGRFYSGAGITEDSDPHKEFLETEMKMLTMKKLIFPELVS